MKKKRSERRMFRWNLKHLGHGLWWGDLNLPLWCVPAGPHGQHTQASTQRNDENGAAWWAHLEDQLQAGGRLRWLLWVGVQWWCLRGLGRGRAGSGGASSLTPLRRSCTSRSMCVDMGNLGWFTDGYKFMRLQDRRGRRMLYLKIGAATRAFSAKGGPLLRTHWPKDSGKICDHTNSHQAVRGSMCDQFHDVQGGGCIGL